MKYKIIGVKFNQYNKLVKCELYREYFPLAEACKASLQAQGYIAAVKPTPEVWTEELRLS